MSVVDGALDEFLETPGQGSEGSGNNANGGQARGEESTQAPRGQWSDAEWRAWNSWWWSGYGSSGNDAGGASEPASGNNGAAGARAVVAEVRNASRHSQAVEWDPWSNSNWEAGQQRGWWQWNRWSGNGGSKGDYADPPSWGGWGNYRLWRRALSRWDANTDVPSWRRSEKVLRQFDWELQSRFEHLTEEQLGGAQYLQHLFQVLDTLAGEKENSERRRAVRAALYEGVRKGEESLSQYSLRREAQFTKASSYMEIPNEIKAFLLEEQAGLSAQGKQNLRSMTGGEVDYDKVKKALVALDIDEEPIVKGHPHKAAQFFQHGDEKDDNSPREELDSASEDDCILFAMQSQELDEDAAMSFLTAWNPDQKRTWSQNKAFKMARRKDRRHFEDRGSRPERPHGRRRLSVAELKKVTKCRRCQQIGHWEEDCKNEPKPKNNSAHSQSKNHGNGFTYLGFPTEGNFTSLSSFLSDILEQGYGKCDHEANFISVPGGFAIIDPGASQDLIGLNAFRALESQLAERGLKTIRLNSTPTPASGVGGSAKPLFEALSPCILGGEPGIVKLTILDEDIPQLLSVGLLEYAGAIIDTCENKISFRRFGRSADMTRMQSGHRIMPVYEWKGKEFPVSEQLQAEFGLKPGDFNLRNSRAAYMQPPETETTNDNSPSFSSKQESWLSQSSGIESSVFSLHDRFGNLVLFCFDAVNFMQPLCRSSNPEELIFRSTWLVNDFHSKEKCSCKQIEDSKNWKDLKDSNSPIPSSFHDLTVSLFSRKPLRETPNPTLQLAEPSSFICECLASLRERLADHVGQQGSSAFEERTRSRCDGSSLVPSDSQTSAEASRHVLPQGAAFEAHSGSPSSGGRMRSPSRVCDQRRKPIRQLGEVSDVSCKIELCPLVQDEPAEEEGCCQEPHGYLCAGGPGAALSIQDQDLQGPTDASDTRSVPPGVGASYEHADGSHDGGDHKLAVSGFGTNLSRTTTSTPEPASGDGEPAEPSDSIRRIWNPTDWRSGYGNESGFDAHGCATTGLELRQPLAEWAPSRGEPLSSYEMDFHGTTSLSAAMDSCAELRSLFGKEQLSGSEGWFISTVSPCLFASSLFLESKSRHIWQGRSGKIFCAWYHERNFDRMRDEDFNDDHWFHVPKKAKKQVVQSSKAILGSFDDSVLNSTQRDNNQEFTFHKLHFAAPVSGVSLECSKEQQQEGFKNNEKHQAVETLGLKEKAMQSHKQPAVKTPGLQEKATECHKQPADKTQGLQENQEKQPASGPQEPGKSHNRPTYLDSSLGHRPELGLPGASAVKSLMASHGKKSNLKFLELFSPPRVSLEVKKAGLSVTSPEAFDLETGWDFFDARDRARFWQVVYEQEPDVIGMSPKCTAFSILMESNWAKMDADKAETLQDEGLQMWLFCIQVAFYQSKRGRYFYIEHPGSASSWSTHSMVALLSDPSVFFFLFDQCMAGLSVKEGTLSRKTTGVVTNHWGVAVKLSQFQCSGEHQHLQLQSGLPVKAQKYPKNMVKAIARGLKWQASSFSFVEGENDEESEDLEEMLDREVDRTEAPSVQAGPELSLSEQQKQKVHKVHVNMGHLAPNKLLVMFKAAGALPQVLKYIKNEFRCSQCMKQQHPIEARKAAFPRTFAFNRFLGVDCFFIPFLGKTVGFLNDVCLGTNLQVIGRLRGFEAGSPSSSMTWKVFQEIWLRPFGSPEVVQTDGGSEFKDKFERGVEQLGTMQIVSDASSPWQNAKVERHGGWLKDRAEQEIQSGDSILSTVDDLEELLIQLVASKNRHFSVGGFSPLQLVFGCNPRIPLELLSEDGLQLVAQEDAEADGLDNDTAAASFARSHAIRLKARDLCFKHHAKDRIRLSGHQRYHKYRNWSIGQWVYVWRRSSAPASGHVTRSRWMGPGIVLLQSGHSVWVSMRSRLLKCNSDQLRAATHYEAMGAELSKRNDLEDVLQQVLSGRTGAIDVAREGTPPAEAFDSGVPPGEAPLVMAPSGPLPVIDENTDNHAPPVPRPGVGVMQGLRGPGPAQEGENTREETVRRPIPSEISLEEPFVEPTPTGNTPASTGVGPVSDIDSNSTKARRTNNPDVSSVVRAENSAPSSSHIPMPRTPRGMPAPSTPAGQRSRRLLSEEEQLERIAAQEVRRADREERRARSRSVPPGFTTDSSLLEHHQSLLHGSSFYIKSNPDSSSVSLLVKPINPKNAEFDMSKATPEERRGFETSDLDEWKALCDLKAVQVLSKKEADQVRAKQANRIITSRMIRRKKPTPGVGNFKFKSRWCVHGHKDPDSHLLQTFSPTPSSESINLFFQVTLNEQLQLAFGDIRNAFGQSDPMCRPTGDIYVEPCKGLSLEEGALVKLIVPVYGLDDAPLRWHQTLLNFFFSIGFERTLLEPCWLVKRKGGKLVAQVLIEVDDINVAAAEHYAEELRNSMTERFEFGKWEFEEADFAGRHVKRDGDRILMNQEKYIVEKLEPVPLTRAQRAEKTRLLENEEFEKFRSMLYRVHWVAHQTRPEASGIVSILSSRLRKATVHDVACLNKLVHHLRSTAQLNLTLHRFDSDKMTFITASDAGGVDSSPPVEDCDGDVVSDAVQGAWVIFASDKMPSHSCRIKVSTLSWRSSKLKRRVSSTLAGEALAFSQALGEVEYLQIMFRDVVFGDVSRSNWRDSISPFLAVLKKDCSLDQRQSQCQITDAKSLYDAVVKQSPASRQDRRTAVEMSIIVETMREAQGVLRWSPHPKMPADVLTKDDLSKSNGALESVLKSSHLGLWNEEEELKLRREDPSSKGRSKAASEKLRLKAEAMSLLVAVSESQVNRKLGELFVSCHLSHESCSN